MVVVLRKDRYLRGEGLGGNSPSLYHVANNSNNNKKHTIDNNKKVQKMRRRRDRPPFEVVQTLNQFIQITFKLTVTALSPMLGHVVCSVAEYSRWERRLSRHYFIATTFPHNRVTVWVWRIWHVHCWMPSLRRKIVLSAPWELRKKLRLAKKNGCPVTDACNRRRITE